MENNKGNLDEVGQDEIKNVEGIKELTAKETKEIVKKNENSMVADKNGYLVGKTLEDQYRLAKCYVQSGMVPKSYTKPEQVLVALQYARELKMPPLLAMKNIAVINGTPSLWGEMPLSLVRKSGELLFIDEYFVDARGGKINFKTKDAENIPIWAAVCEIQRKGDEKKEFVWTEVDASTAIKGITAIWQKYPRIMWKRKCRAIAIKDVFTDVLFGMGIAEYDQEWSPDRDEKELEAGPKSDINDSVGDLS